ncbi:hypothetical protein H4R21_006566 [Coemansia helicoidea]|uniref:Uncharacterized protein n=1 Tax=Coemansia helicoidea TaxID=1286919 RepID=A0ACC1KIF0_9FUNG|nr:hypothetical protein H4R21_006566 [Coemansia helicoidea]
MAQIQAHASDSPRSLRRPRSPAAPPQLPSWPHAVALGDARHDDLPPYVDPIDEAIASDTPLSHGSDHDLSQPDIQCPPPYDTIATPDRAEIRY